jgi:hypothetical protein
VGWPGSRTLAHLRAHLEKRGAATVEICTLLDKVERRVAHVECKYIGFQVRSTHGEADAHLYARRVSGLAGVSTRPAGVR